MRARSVILALLHASREGERVSINQRWTLIHVMTCLFRTVSDGLPVLVCAESPT